MSTTLSKNFEPQEPERKWYEHWVERGYFNSTPDEREPYTIVMPPPNVTGVLHMGHALNNTIQDILIRRARMQGKNACWVPGTDHASIATEAKVVGMLRERGITKSSLSRQEFLAYAWEWKEKYGGIILQQLKKLGCSPDWNRTSFTMDRHYYDSVIKVFIDLYQKGLIYRGKRMINWDVKAKTALSDEEVIFKEVQSQLYYLKYFLVDDGGQMTDKREINSHNSLSSVIGQQSSDFITIATVRPETILGDTAIFVNPNDERYSHLVGRKAYVPLINRAVPIMADEYVEMDFGTGALKVTPAHDKNDYALSQKHNLPVIDMMNDDGTLNAEAQLYIGEDRFAVRKKIVTDLEAAGHLVKTEAYTNQVGFSERTDVVVEQKLSLQWWVKMKPLAEQALGVVMNGDIQFVPPKFKNLYRHWMEGIKDWCISRQLWWGQQIPAWYDEEGRYVVAATEEEAKKLFHDQFSVENPRLKQDEDCLDTWFSSWLWPFEVFKGLSNPGNAEVEYYYPTNTLVTAPEIIFFWVARMIMAGLEYRKDIPFTEVYFTGIVRDKLGRKMSKSLGNSPDLLGLIDNYGADAVRFGVMIASPAGSDIMFDEASLEQGRNFNNKLWNALKLVKSWEGRIEDRRQITDDSSAFNTNNPLSVNDHPSSQFAGQWFRARLNEAKAEVEALYKDFKLSEALKVIYSLIWDDFCSWYLEWAKPGFEQPVDVQIYQNTVGFFTELVQLLHPFMPFITEEIYHQLAERTDDLCVKQAVPVAAANSAVLSQGQLLQELITAIRDARVKNNLKPKDAIQLYLQTDQQELLNGITPILSRQINASSVQYASDAVSNSVAVVSGTHKLYIVWEGVADTKSQREQLQKDLDYLKGFMLSVEKKLGNEKFVQHAKPEIIAAENKKKEDAGQKIKALEESLARLNV